MHSFPRTSATKNSCPTKKPLIVYDATIYFSNRFIDKKSRTYDQMVQAARSGKQNITEGSEASATSKEAEIKLTGVAKASQKELLEDYRDFMRERGIEEWPATHPYAQRLRRLNRSLGANYQTLRKGIEQPDPAICANVIVGIIKVTCYLLAQQLTRLEQDFLNQGGLRERMTRARLAARGSREPVKGRNIDEVTDLITPPFTDSCSTVSPAAAIHSRSSNSAFL